MKILYVTTISKTINSFLIPHIKSLIQEGYSVDIMTNLNGKIEDEFIIDNCQIYNIPFSRNPLSFKNLVSIRNIKVILKSEGYDLIHTHTPVASSLVRVANILSIKTKVIYTAHGFHFYKGAPATNWIIYYPIEKILARSTDGIITINEEDYINTLRKLKPKYSRLINGVGIDLSTFNPVTTNQKNLIRQNLGIPQEKFVLFYAAELNKNKNQRLLIDALTDLINIIPTIHLYLAGEGKNKAYLEKMIRKNNLSNNVTLLGNVDNVDKWLKSADILVASSKREGLPVNLIEGLAVGLPIIASDIRGHRDIVEESRNGYLFNLNDVEKLVQKVIYLQKNHEKYAQIRSNNINKSSLYTNHNINSLIVAITDEVLKL